MEHSGKGFTLKKIHFSQIDSAISCWGYKRKLPSEKKAKFIGALYQGLEHFGYTVEGENGLEKRNNLRKKIKARNVSTYKNFLSSSST